MKIVEIVQLHFRDATVSGIIARDFISGTVPKYGHPYQSNLPGSNLTLYSRNTIQLLDKYILYKQCVGTKSVSDQDCCENRMITKLTSTNNDTDADFLYKHNCENNTFFLPIAIEIAVLNINI